MPILPLLPILSICEKTECSLKFSIANLGISLYFIWAIVVLKCRNVHIKIAITHHQSKVKLSLPVKSGSHDGFSVAVVTDSDVENDDVSLVVLIAVYYRLNVTLPYHVINSIIAVFDRSV